MEKVCVIIINWNGKKHLEKCLPAISEQSYPNYEIMVVDNGSTDGTIDYINNYWPKVRIIALKENKFFASGNNIGIQQALKNKEISYIALLNNDTIADKNWLSEMVKITDTDPRIGIVAAKLMKMGNQRIIDSTGHIFDKWGKIVDRGHNEIDSGQYDTKVDVLGACAAACLYRRTMLEDIGLFDERLVMYYEDAELSWRAYKRDWKAKYVPTAVVLHERGASRRKNDKALSVTSSFRRLKNQITVVKKYANKQQKIVYALRLCWKLIRALRNTLTNTPGRISLSDYLALLRYFFKNGLNS
ncbi:MAG: glycosyltransferase family 2 protein [Planctomycetota bacterium]